MGDPPGLDAAHVAQALGEGRGNQATLVVAAMETKGTRRVDFYEVGHTTINCASQHECIGAHPVYCRSP